LIIKLLFSLLHKRIFSVPSAKGYITPADLRLLSAIAALSKTASHRLCKADTAAKKRRRQAQYGKSHNPGSSQPLLGNQRIIAFKAPLPGLLRDALP